MAAFYAEFRWSLPPNAATVQRYAETLARRAGCAYDCRVHPSAATDTVDAAIDFPHVSHKNLVGLKGSQGTLDFAPLPFLWIHALRAIQELGGTLVHALPVLESDWRERRWDELGWTERIRFRVGLGPWVK